MFKQNSNNQFNGLGLGMRQRPAQNQIPAWSMGQSQQNDAGYQSALMQQAQRAQYLDRNRFDPMRNARQPMTQPQAYNGLYFDASGVVRQENINNPVHRDQGVQQRFYRQSMVPRGLGFANGGLVTSVDTSPRGDKLRFIDNEYTRLRDSLSNSKANRQNQQTGFKQKQQQLDQDNAQYYANLNALSDRQQAELAYKAQQDAFLNQLAQQKANQDNAQYYAGLDQKSDDSLQNVNLRRMQNAIAQQQANQQNDQYYARLALDKEAQAMDNRLKEQQLSMEQMKAQQMRQANAKGVPSVQRGISRSAFNGAIPMNPYSEDSAYRALGFASGGYVSPGFNDPFRIDYNFLAQQRNQSQFDNERYDQARQDSINQTANTLGSQFGIANMQNQTDVLKANNDYSLGRLNANNNYALGNRNADITDRNYQGQLALGNKTQDQNNALALKNQQLTQDKFDFKKGFLNSFGKSFLGFAKGGQVSAAEDHPVMPSDTVNAWLTPKEFVFSVPAVEAIGVKALTKFNKDAISGKLDEKDKETAEKIKGGDDDKAKGYARGGLVETDALKQAGNYLSWQTPSDQQVMDDYTRGINSGPNAPENERAALTVNSTDDLVESELEHYMSDPKNSWQWERYSQRTSELDPSMSSKFSPTATKMGTYSQNGAAARDVQHAFNKVRAEKKAQIQAQMAAQQQGGSRQGGQRSSGRSNGAIPKPGMAQNVGLNGEVVPFLKPGETPEDMRIQETIANAIKRDPNNYLNKQQRQPTMTNAYPRGFALGGEVEGVEGVDWEWQKVGGKKIKKYFNRTPQVANTASTVNPKNIPVDTMPAYSNNWEFGNSPVSKGKELIPFTNPDPYSGNLVRKPVNFNLENIGKFAKSTGLGIAAGIGADLYNKDQIQKGVNKIATGDASTWDKLGTGLRAGADVIMNFPGYLKDFSGASFDNSPAQKVYNNLTLTDNEKSKAFKDTGQTGEKLGAIDSISTPKNLQQPNTKKPIQKLGSEVVPRKNQGIQQNERGEFVVDYGNGNTVGVKDKLTAQRMQNEFDFSGKSLNDYHDINQPFVMDSDKNSPNYGRVARGLGNIGVVASGGNNAFDGSVKAYNDPISQVQTARENGNKDYVKMFDILNNYSDRRAIDDQNYRDQKYIDSLKGLTPDEQFNSLYGKSVQDMLTPIDRNASPRMQAIQEGQATRGLGMNKLITEQQDYLTKSEEARQEKADKANTPVLNAQVLKSLGIGDLPAQEQQKVFSVNTKDTLLPFYRNLQSAKSPQEFSKHIEIFSRTTGVPIAIAERLAKPYIQSDYIDMGAGQQ